MSVAVLMYTTAVCPFCIRAKQLLAARGVTFAFTSGKGVGDIDARFANRPVFSKPVDENKLKIFLESLKQP